MNKMTRRERLIATIKGEAVDRPAVTSLTRRDKALDTGWAIEYLLKNIDDVNLFLEFPDEIFEEDIDIAYFVLY